ncbi:MAG: hypothetical protein EOP42_23710 [Sphingobacteriaceae bacterium]|nr:MAG: hypothetical protein EOP42_23710 [Sphingobacteriaceae bacterium]
MMKSWILFLSVLFCFELAFAQNKKPEDFGFRHLIMRYQKDTVDILILSKKGEEQKVKPVFLFVQGSLPTPLIILDENKKPYQVFPFNPDSILVSYHLAIISKPGIPVILEKQNLQPNYTYLNTVTKAFPQKFITNDNLDYYVKRGVAAIKYLKKQKWVAKNKFVIAGHSAGSTIAAKLALSSKNVTHLIYAGGDPMGRLVTMVETIREDTTAKAVDFEEEFTYWRKVVANPESRVTKTGDSNKTNYSFSIPPINYLKKIKIPVLVSYGTKDYGAPFNNFLRLETIRLKKNNFTYNAYWGLEHNFFGFNKDGSVNYNVYNWDKVGLDWLQWLQYH